MPLTELNHYFVRCGDLELSKRWYCDVLGFELMPRPPLPFPGYWLGVAGKTQIHMGQAGDTLSEQYYLGISEGRLLRSSGVVDHIAFTGEDPAEFHARLDAAGVSYRARSFPEASLYQIFVEDPDGLFIEIGFLDQPIGVKRPFL